MRRIRKLEGLILSLTAWTGAAWAGPDSAPETALEDYVASADPSFGWRVHARYQVPGAEVVQLHLESQTWRSVLWKHQLYLIKPSNVDASLRQGAFAIAGGRWRPHYETDVADELPDDSRIFIAIASRIRSVVAVLAQVPFQPLFGLTEDELIAHTFERYLETGDAEWPLLLPMVKSVVRGMDATQAFAADDWGIPLDGFTVLGASKRGWTTWLTGAVEPRATTLIPIVIDVLNFERHLPYQSTVWGAPSQQIAPYTRRGLHTVLGSDAGRDLRAVADPYSYRDRLTQPKLIVVATNDAYFPVDALNLYWDELPEPKRILYLPNDEHSADDFLRLIPAVAAMHRQGAEGTPLPALDWQYQRRDGVLRLCVRADPAPAAVTAWIAASEDTDFRDARFAPSLVAADEGIYVVDVDWPAAGHRAVFAEAAFGAALGGLTLSTNLRIADAQGRPPTAATAIEGRPGVCPEADD